MVQLGHHFIGLGAEHYDDGIALDGKGGCGGAPQQSLSTESKQLFWRPEA